MYCSSFELFELYALNHYSIFGDAVHPIFNMEFKQKLKKALFYNDFERTKSLFVSSNFTSDLLVDCGDFDGIPTPVYYISLLWNEVLPGDWGFINDVVGKQRENLNKITTFIEDKFQVSAKGCLNLQLYRKFYNYEEEYDVNDVESIMFSSKDELYDVGFRDIDIDLYCAAYLFDFNKTERLLQLGAKDDICKYKNEEDSSIYAKMRDDFLEREDWQTQTLKPHPDYKIRKCNKRIIRSLFRSAAKYRMVKLMDKYYKLNHPVEQKTKDEEQD
jgi:hypothetical protein